MSALPSSGKPSSEGITPRSSLLRTHSPIPCGSSCLRLLASCEESLQVVTSPCCHRDSPHVSLRILPRMLGPIPRRVPHSVYTCFFLCVIGLPNQETRLAPLCSANTTFRRGIVEAADIPLCSGLRVFSPSRSFLPLCLSHMAAEAFTFGLSVLRYLRTHRICKPPATGN
jgi:hypothetical protein